MSMLNLSEILEEIKVPPLECSMEDFSSFRQAREKEGLFDEHQRKAWDKSVEARCDFTRRVRITRRSDVFFISLWQKSVMGKTLKEIKADESMVNFFTNEITPLISDILGDNLQRGQWCIITTPKRRHTTKNFATQIAEQIADRIGIKFYEDVCSCRTKQRMNAIFTVNIVPKEPNIICFDDFVTTGQTLLAMKRALAPHNKNIIFFTGINNKL